MAKDIDDKPMSIGEHLEELRKRSWLAIVGILPIFCLGLYFGHQILQLIVDPLIEALKAKHIAGGGMMTTSVLEGFSNYLKIATVLAVVVGGPWIVYQTWKFVAPGLYARERRFFYILSPMSVMFSALGLVFMYKVMLPFVLFFFVTFNEGLLVQPPTPQVDMPAGMHLSSLPTFAGDPKNPRPGEMWLNTEREAVRVALPHPDAKDKSPEEQAKMPPLVLSLPLHSDSFVVQQYKVAEYVSLVLTFAFAFALTFQTPVVVLLLGWIGIIDVRTIGRYRKWALLVCTAIAAVVTPPDFWSMVSLMVPMYMLFEVGVILLRIMPAGKVASGRFFGRAEPRDGEGSGSGDPTARPDDR